jgi:hypothetical protein
VTQKLFPSFPLWNPISKKAFGSQSIQEMHAAAGVFEAEDPVVMAAAAAAAAAAAEAEAAAEALRRRCVPQHCVELCACARAVDQSKGGGRYCKPKRLADAGSACYLQARCSSPCRLERTWVQPSSWHRWSPP